MDAIVLVGGQGTRLRPLTDRRHKSLVPLCNRPAIEYLFDWLRCSGFKRVVLALGKHNDDLARAYPAGYHNGLRFEVVRENERLESGGAIRNAVQMAGIEGRFAVLNGDVFVDFDFAVALKAHQSSQAELTLALHDVEDPSQFGVAVTDEQNLITQFVEKPPRSTAPSHSINAGVWIFEPGLVAEIPAGAVRVEDTLFPSLVRQRRRVLGYQFEGPWEDIGTPERYLALNLLLLERGHPGIAEDARIATSAQVDHSSIGSESHVCDGAKIAGSVIWEEVWIGEGARVTGSVIADGVIIGEGAVLTNAMVGSHAEVGPGVIVPPGTSIDAETRYDDSHER